MKRVVVGVLGAGLGLLGLAILGGGLVLLAIFGTDGKATVPIGALSAPDARAVVVTDFQISSSTPLPVDQSWFDLEVEVTGTQSHFVGVAPKTDALGYLQGVSYHLVTGFDSSNGMIDAITIPGDARPADPAAQSFWADQRTGEDIVVDWPVSSTDTTLVVMNDDLRPGVDADVSVLLTIGWAGAAGIGAAIAGLVLLIVAIVMLVLAFRRPAAATGAASGWPGPQGG